MSALIPIARTPVSVRPATLDDLPFIDRLQKAQSKQVGFLHTKALEGKIKLGHILIAEEGLRTEDSGLSGIASAVTQSPVLSPQSSTPVGYCIGNDQYFKRDDVGIIYQMNVVPGARRKLVGATLVKAMFDRAAYGCKLFCCWCAQDIEANRFWESLGFVPLAFRAGSREKDRTHIFWQRRIRDRDTTTPYWFPAQTSSGAIREDRLVFPIPPGVNWNDEMPRILPREESPKLETRNSKQAQSPRQKTENKPPVHTLGRLVFARPAEKKTDKPKREKKPKLKNDPRLVAAARELRDRWLEQVNAEGGASRILGAGKYQVSRALPDTPTASTSKLVQATPALPAPLPAPKAA